MTETRSSTRTHTIYNSREAHYDRVSTKRYSCDHCEFSTGHRKKIRQHIMDAHDITTDSMDDSSAVSESYTAQSFRG